MSPWTIYALSALPGFALFTGILSAVTGIGMAVCVGLRGMMEVSTIIKGDESEFTNRDKDATFFCAKWLTIAFAVFATVTALIPSQKTIDMLTWPRVVSFSGQMCPQNITCYYFYMK